MERQKLWICIGIAFLLLIAVIAAVLLSMPQEQTRHGASFVLAESNISADIVTDLFERTIYESGLQL